MALGAGVHGAALFLMTADALAVIGGHAARDELLSFLFMAGGAGNVGALDALAGKELTIAVAEGMTVTCNGTVMTPDERGYV